MGLPLTETFNIGQSPFLSIGEKYDWSILILNPNYLPEDGKGLNLLLRNIWMIIHPPVIFLAFALSSIPFSLMIANDRLSCPSRKGEQAFLHPEKLRQSCDFGLC